MTLNLIGQKLGQYQIVEQIGQGGMATVYKAYQPGLDRFVAVKVLPAQHALTPGFKERFIQEARAVAQLSHPNILPIYDVGIEGDLSYFAMKYVAGPTLRERLGQPLDLPTMSRYIDQIAGALDHAHVHNLVHRDVKPSNILIEGDWLLLADFGLAKIVTGSAALTGSGIIIGTPAYLSPEQAEGKPADLRADIYSLGVVLYEMALGQVPYDADTPIGILFKHIYEPLPRPRRLRPDLPAGVEQIILKALAKNPAHRFNHAGELAEALHAQLTPNLSPLPPLPPVVPARLFISYKRHVDPDQPLANYLYEFLIQQGHSVFIDRTLRTGDDWLGEIDRQIQNSDFLIVLLSPDSAYSEMVQAEVRRAFEYRRLQGHPRTLPVRVAHEGLLPYSIDAFLEPLHYAVWQTPADNERIAQEILVAIAGHLPFATSPPPLGQVFSGGLLSEDGGLLIGTEGLHPPLPEFDPRFLEALDAPGGVVRPRDKLYIERHADALLRREALKAGSTTTIRASRQTGKSSLLVRGINHARENGARIVNLDLQRLDADRLASPDLFLRDLAELLVRKLRLDPTQVEHFWQGSLGPQDKLTYLMEDYILPESDTPIVLALDEVDRLLQTSFHNDFFALLRAWHNSRALDEQWDRLNIVMVISTEPYLLIDDVNQSPFNVGLRIYLEDFDPAQVRDLNQRHGSPVSEADFVPLFELLGGQPYLTRKALYTIMTERMPWPQLNQVAVQEHGPFGDHLRRQQWLLRNEPALRQALKEIIEQNRCANEAAISRLLHAGLIKGSGDHYACRCDLYRRYFKDKL